jgi:hypothetical protein
MLEVRGLDKLEAGLFTAVEQALPNPAIDSIYNVQRIGRETSDLHDLGYTARIKAFEPRPRPDLIEGAQIAGSYQTVGFFSLRAAASERSIFRGSVEYCANAS